MPVRFASLKQMQNTWATSAHPTQLFLVAQKFTVCVFTALELCFQVARKGKGYLKTENRVRAYRTHPTSGLEVSCGLRLTLLINSKCFNIFFNIYSFPF